MCLGGNRLDNFWIFCGAGGLWFNSIPRGKILEEEVTRFVKKCSDSGVKQVSSCAVSVGLACYSKSRMLRTWSEDDLLGTLIDIAHDHDIEVHPYIPFPLSMGENLLRESGSGVGEKSPVTIGSLHFKEDHPEYFIKTRDNEQEQFSLCYAYPETRAYARSIITEIAQHYDIDGIVLEWNPEPWDGKASLRGYTDRAVKEFREEYGIDPYTIENSDERWMDFRTQYNTMFVREVRNDLSQLDRNIEITSMDWTPAKPFLRDWSAWIEERLVDRIVSMYTPGLFQASGNRGVSSYHVYQYAGEMRKMVKGPCESIIGLVTYRPPYTQGRYQVFDTSELLENGAEAALAAQSDGVAVYRADFIEFHGLWDSIARIGEMDAFLRPMTPILQGPLG